jgi:hypothetical protein
MCTYTEFLLFHALFFGHRPLKVKKKREYILGMDDTGTHPLEPSLNVDDTASKNALRDKDEKLKDADVCNAVNLLFQHLAMPTFGDVDFSWFALVFPQLVRSG